MQYGFTPTPENKKNLVDKNGKSHLARLMAMENLTVEHKNCSTAYFDTKNRILGLPLWENMSNELYDCLVGHEIGHALETPDLMVATAACLPGAKGIQELCSRIDPNNMGGVKTFINVIEDARIEKLVKNRYPGMRYSFVVGYREFMQRDLFGIKGKDLSKYPFIDRLNIHFKVGSLALVPFSTKEEELVKMVADCVTWNDVMAAVVKIYAYSKERAETDNHRDGEEDGDQKSKKSKKGEKSKEGKKSEKSEKSEKSDEDGDEDGPGTDGEEADDADGDDEDASEGSDGDDDAADTDEDGAEDGDGSEGSDSDKDPADDAEEKDAPKEAGSKGHGNGKGDSAPTEPPKSLTDTALEENKKGLSSAKGQDIRYVNIPAQPFDLETVIIPYKTVLADFTKLVIDTKDIDMLVKDFTDSNMRTISYMVQEFEMKKCADKYNKTKKANTGTINTNKLHTYKFNEDIFKRISVVPKGKKHGLVLFIDWSSSMTSNMSGTIDQLLNLVMFCKKVQIPFEVYAFSNNSALRNSAKRGSTLQQPWLKNGDITMGSFHLIQFLSSAMNREEYAAAFKTMVAIGNYYTDSNSRSSSYYSYPSKYFLSSTPLNHSIVAAMQIVPKFKEQTKAQVVSTVFLTDGDSDPSYDAYRAPGTSGFSGYGYETVIRDGVTKSEYKDNGHYSAGDDTTTILLRILRDRVGGSVTGFFVMPGANKKSLERSIFPRYFSKDIKAGVPTTKLYEDFTNNKFMVAKDVGYDEYYFIPGGKALKTSDKEFDITGKKSVSSIARAFTAYANQKKVNRVMLGRFITQIA